MMAAVVSETFSTWHPQDETWKMNTSHCTSIFTNIYSHLAHVFMILPN